MSVRRGRALSPLLLVVLAASAAPVPDEGERAIAPYVQQARETWPAVRARYLGGLPPGETLFVVTRLTDASQHAEQVFLRVTHVEGAEITGTISSQPTVVRGYQPWQSVTLKDTELIDWMISKPDGAEEGNFVGRFLDSQR